MKILISESQLRNITEVYIDLNGNLVGLESNIFDKFPPDVLETLEKNYGHIYLHNYDWNEKQNEFTDDDDGFRKWKNNNEQEEFKKNFNKILSSVRHDLILLKRIKFSQEKLDKFEDLVKSVLGSNVTSEDLSQFEYVSMLFVGFMDDIETQNRKIEQAMQDAKNILDKDGNIDSSKVTKSGMFVDMITIDSFEKYVKKHPEYMGMCEVWKKLFFEQMDLETKDTISFYIVPYKELRKLYDFLMKNKTQRYTTGN
jgi:hypothetical protein